MTDTQYLFAVVIIVYLFECVAWIHAQAVSFRWTSPGRGSGSFANISLGNPDGGLILKPLIPTLGNFGVVRLFPLSISDRGVLSFIADAPSRDLRCRQAEKYFPWRQVATITRLGRVISVNGSFFVRLGSVTQAKWTQELLSELAKLPADRRAARIDEAFQAMFDMAAIEKRIADYDRATGALRFFCFFLFLHLFVAAPFLVLRFGIEETWLRLLIVLAFLDVAIIAMYVRASLRLQPNSDGDLWIHALSMFLNPVAATRACDRVCRDLLGEFHPLAMARVVCGANEFRSVAHALYVDLKYPFLPLCPGAGPEALETEEWSRRRKVAQAELFLRHVGLLPEELLRAEAALDASARSYCPRCQRHFEQVASRCEPCGGIETLPWHDAAAPVASSS